MVEQHTFVVIEVARLAGPGIKMAREFEHVINAAALGGRDVHLQLGAKLPGLRRPAFAIAGSSGYVAACADHFVPKEIGDVMESHVA